MSFLLKVPRGTYFILERNYGPVIPFLCYKDEEPY